MHVLDTRGYVSNTKHCRSATTPNALLGIVWLLQKHFFIFKVASSVTETWWTILPLNCCKANIRLEGGWTAQLQQYNNYFIAKLPTRASITMQPRQWKLFREMFIFLNITTIADIVTTCGQFITKEAYAGVQSMNPFTNGHVNNISYPKLTTNYKPSAWPTSPGRAPGTYVNPWEHGPQHQQPSDPTEWRATNSSPNNKMDPGSSMTNVYINSKRGQPRSNLKRWGATHWAPQWASNSQRSASRYHPHCWT